MSKRGQPYVGAFLFKDENADKDVIDSPDEVHDVGVFAQITSTFPVHHGEKPGMTAVLYPHRRIKMTGLSSPESNAAAEPAQEEKKETPEAPQPEKENTGDVVASFEEKAPEPAPKEAVRYDPTAFLRKLPVSIVNVENLTEESFDKKSPVIRAVTSEIVNVFKDVANLNPLFRDQISTFSMSQSAGNITEEPAKLADFAAAVSAGELNELQEVLETMNIEDRLSKALVVLKKELMNAQLQSKISKDVEAKIQKRQREYWLMEQMKGIRRELGIEYDDSTWSVSCKFPRSTFTPRQSDNEPIYSTVGGLSPPTGTLTGYAYNSPVCTEAGVSEPTYTANSYLWPGDAEEFSFTEPGGLSTTRTARPRPRKTSNCGAVDADSDEPEDEDEVAGEDQGEDQDEDDDSDDSLRKRYGGRRCARAIAVRSDDVYTTVFSPDNFIRLTITEGKDKLKAACTEWLSHDRLGGPGGWAGYGGWGGYWVEATR
ncbi:ATP-dependent Lon protease pim1, partial [Ascosphaera atra]